MTDDKHEDGLMIDVRLYGARGDGASDDTAAIQAAFNTATKNRLGATVIIPSGAYKITGTLTLADVTGLVVIGSGGRPTLPWGGNAADPPAQLSSVPKSHFEDFTINSASARPLAMSIRMITQAGA